MGCMAARPAMDPQRHALAGGPVGWLVVVEHQPIAVGKQDFVAYRAIGRQGAWKVDRGQRLGMAGTQQSMRLKLGNDRNWVLRRLIGLDWKGVHCTSLPH